MFHTYVICAAVLPVELPYLHTSSTVHNMCILITDCYHYICLRCILDKLFNARLLLSPSFLAWSTGSSPSPSLIKGFAPCSSSVLTAFPLPQVAATCRAVKPSKFCQSTSAPCCSSASKMSAEGWLADM